MRKLPQFLIPLTTYINHYHKIYVDSLSFQTSPHPLCLRQTPHEAGLFQRALKTASVFLDHDNAGGGLVHGHHIHKVWVGARGKPVGWIETVNAQTACGDWAKKKVTRKINFTTVMQFLFLHQHEGAPSCYHSAIVITFTPSYTPLQNLYLVCKERLVRLHFFFLEML